MIYELINPSDAYTLETDDEAAACIAILFVGEGRYGLKRDDGSVALPLFLFGGFVDGWAKRTHGIDDIGTWAKENAARLADALDSVLIGTRAERAGIVDMLQHVPDEKRAAAKAEWLDRRRRSLNDIGGVCAGMAERLREVATTEGAST